MNTRARFQYSFHQLVDAMACWLVLRDHTHPDWQDLVARHALAVARTINGTQEQP
ncbi:hypothetical protein [Streptomyces sp. NPDC020298]|uniref:hypothetical protein n=1 Tax=unclassified Streptomyces TaxID=2593676 RepID=UPI0034013BAC